MNEHTEKKHNMQSPEDRDSIIYQKGFSAGTEHSRPSPETLTKIAQMSEDITNLKVETSEIKSDVKYLVKALDSHILEEGKNKVALEATINNKADKSEVDKIKNNLERVVWIVLIAVLGAILSLIIIK
jgi:regulator of replication initiation timing